MITIKELKKAIKELPDSCEVLIDYDEAGGSNAAEIGILSIRDKSDGTEKKWLQISNYL